MGIWRHQWLATELLGPSRLLRTGLVCQVRSIEKPMAGRIQALCRALSYGCYNLCGPGGTKYAAPVTTLLEA